MSSPQSATSEQKAGVASSDGDCHFNFKVCVLGDSGVGKTTLVQGGGTGGVDRRGANASGVGVRVCAL